MSQQVDGGKCGPGLVCVLVMVGASAVFAAPATVPAGGASPEDTKEPSLEKLLELNAALLFGGTVKAEKGRMTVTYDKDQFNRGFQTSSRRGRFVFDPGKILNTRHKEWAKGADKQFGLVGIHEGRAVSRFELADDFKISFSLKIPELSPRGVFALRLNQRGREYIQTNFFTEIRLVPRKGKKRHQKATDDRFGAPPVKWFDRKAKAGVPFAINFKEGKLTVFTGKKKDDKKGQTEIVSMPRIETPDGGKLSFVFGNLDFVLIRDLRIEGAIPRAWAEKEIARLRRAGTLKTKKDPPREEKEPERRNVARGSKKGEGRGLGRGLKKRDWDKEVEVDIDKDDPEIGEDL